MELLDDELELEEVVLQEIVLEEIVLEERDFILGTMSDGRRVTSVEGGGIVEIATIAVNR